MSEVSTRICLTCHNKVSAAQFFCRRCAEPLRPIVPWAVTSQESPFDLWPEVERKNYLIALCNFYRVYLEPPLDRQREPVEYELCSICETPVHESDVICPTCGNPFTNLLSLRSVPTLMLARRLRVEWNRQEEEDWLDSQLVDLVDTGQVRAALYRRAAQIEKVLNELRDYTMEHFDEMKQALELQRDIKDDMLSRIYTAFPDLAQDARKKAMIEGLTEKLAEAKVRLMAEAYQAGLNCRNWVIYYNYPLMLPEDAGWSKLSDSEKLRMTSLLKEMRLWRELPYWAGNVGFSLVLVAASISATIDTSYFDRICLFGGIVGLFVIAGLSAILSSWYSERLAWPITKVTRLIAWLSVVGSVVAVAFIYSLVWGALAMAVWCIVAWAVNLGARTATWQIRKMLSKPPAVG